jgi:hypothetical protein
LSAASTALGRSALLKLLDVKFPVYRDTAERGQDLRHSCQVARRDAIFGFVDDTEQDLPREPPVWHEMITFGDRAPNTVGLGPDFRD